MVVARVNVPTKRQVIEDRIIKRDTLDWRVFAKRVEYDIYI